MTFVAWPEIESFHNIRKYTKSHPEILNGASSVSYGCKVKLHGTNSAVQVHTNGNVIAQSRTKEIFVNDDNAGFARWVESNKNKLAEISNNTDEDIIIYGEWCGKGIQKGVAISDIDKKVFVVFAAKILDESNAFIIKPHLLTDLVKDIPDTYVLPWHKEKIVVDWEKAHDQLESNVDLINLWVEQVETNDPWVENTFGIKGVGEGLVFYPISDLHLDFDSFSNLCFKAKGEKHKNIKNSLPAQVEPNIAISINEFVDMVLTEARLNQGVDAVGGSLTFDLKLIGSFLTWIENDVIKETKDELEASNLKWNQVSKSISNKARTWYITNHKKI